MPADGTRVPGHVADDLLGAARLGEGWAFEGIYKALGGPVLRYLAAQGAVDPEAATQDVFLRAFRALERFQGDGEALRSWVFTIARNRLVDERRAALRRPRADRDDALDDLCAAGAEEDLEAVLDRARVRFVLDALPAEQREVVVLRFLVDLPLADVAEVTGRSLEAVKALQHRALARLRKVLAESRPAPASPTGVPSFTAS